MTWRSLVKSFCWSISHLRSGEMASRFPKVLLSLKRINISRCWSAVTWVQLGDCESATLSVNLYHTHQVYAPQVWKPLTCLEYLYKKIFNFVSAPWVHIFPKARPLCLHKVDNVASILTALPPDNWFISIFWAQLEWNWSFATWFQ